MREKSKEMDPPRRMTGRGLKERIGSGSLEDTLEDKNLMEPPEVRLSRWNDTRACGPPLVNRLCYNASGYGKHQPRR